MVSCTVGRTPSGGVGAAVSRCLAERGSPVCLTWRSNKDSAQQMASAIAADGGRASLYQVDVTDPGSVAAALEAATAEYGHLHTIVIAIGADISMSYVSEVDPDEWTRTIDADLNGTFNVVRAALPLMRKQGGSFVAISSSAVHRHAQKDILSIIPKAGVEALMRGIAREEGRYGIRANSVALGVIDGGLFDRIRQRVDERFIDAMKRNTALRRFGTMRDAAEAVVFLASAKAGFITGQSLVVDGGFTV